MFSRLLLLSVTLTGCKTTTKQTLWAGGTSTSLPTFKIWQEGNRQSIEQASGKQSTFSAIAVAGLATSPDGKHVAYPARDGKRWHIIADGERGLGWEEIADVRYSPTNQLVYTAKRSGEWCVVVAGEETHCSDQVLVDSFSFSLDNSCTAFVIENSAGQQTVVVNGWQQTKWADSIRDLKCSRVGGTWSFILENQGKSFHGYKAIVSAPFEEIAQTKLSFDGSRSAFLGRREGRWYAILNGEQEYGPFDEVSQVEFSADGNRSAVVGKDKSGAFVIVDGKRGRSFRAIRAGSFRFNYSGEHFFYIARSKKGESVVFDNEIHPRRQRVSEARFSPDGSTWGYIAREKTCTKTHPKQERCRPRLRDALYLNGKFFAEYPGASDLRFSDDGEIAALVGRYAHGDCVYFRDRASCHAVVLPGTLQLTADGEHWGCIAADSSTKRFSIIVDGEPRTQFTTSELLHTLAKYKTTNALFIVRVMQRWVLGELREVDAVTAGA